MCQGGSSEEHTAGRLEQGVHANCPGALSAVHQCQHCLLFSPSSGVGCTKPDTAGLQNLPFLQRLLPGWPAEASAELLSTATHFAASLKHPTLPAERIPATSSQCDNLSSASHGGKSATQEQREGYSCATTNGRLEYTHYMVGTIILKDRQKEAATQIRLTGALVPTFKYLWLLNKISPSEVTKYCSSFKCLLLP